MRSQSWIKRAVPFAAVALVGMAPMAFAQGQELFEWNGRVDSDVQIMMQGNRVWTNNIGPNEPGRARARSVSMMPRQDGMVTAQLVNGRGNVNVIQQPSAQNGYTAIIDVRDPQGGASNYRVVAYWQNYANGEVYNNGRYDRDNGRYDRNNDRVRNPRVYGNNQLQNARSMMHWSGNVDGELEIRIQNGQVSYRNISGDEATQIQSSMGNLNVPAAGAQVAVIQNEGRGSVSVVQQPSSYNGYTTVIRVRDPQRGAGYYDFDLMWAR